jgi:hypothetical protein
MSNYSDHAADALRYAMMSSDDAIRSYQRRQAIIEAHPDWTPDQVDAHYELTRPIDPEPTHRAQLEVFKAKVDAYAAKAKLAIR